MYILGQHMGIGYNVQPFTVENVMYHHRKSKFPIMKKLSQLKISPFQSSLVLPTCLGILTFVTTSLILKLILLKDLCHHSPRYA